MELLFHYMYINYQRDLAVLPLDQRVQQANSRTSASSCWCGRRRGGRDPRCWPAASTTTSRRWTQPRGPAGSDARPSCVQGARFRVARGLLDPRLALLRGHTRQREHCSLKLKRLYKYRCYAIAPLRCAHTTAVDDRRSPPVRRAACGLVLSCLIHASCWANAPRWGGRLRCWLAAPLPLPQTWTCCAVQIVTRVPLSLYLGPRLVNVVSLRKRPNSLYLQNKLSPYLDALQHLSPLPPVLRQLLPLRHLQLTQQRLHPSYLLAFHCCFLRHFC